MKEYYIWLLKAYNEFLRDMTMDATNNDWKRRTRSAVYANNRKTRARFFKWDSKFKAEITRVELALPFQK